MWWRGIDNKGCKVQVYIDNQYPANMRDPNLYTISAYRNSTGYISEFAHMKVKRGYDSDTIIDLIECKAPLCILADALDEDENLKTIDGNHKSWLTMQLRKSCLVEDKPNTILEWGV